MEAPAPHFNRFLRALHRRLVVVRALERTGVGVLAGCAAAGALIPLLLWRGESALTPALFLLALGACAGLLWGVTHRPTALAAAMEADRQLGLADLLGTAASCAAAGDDPWSRTVLAIANERCRQHVPSQVLLNRLGGRAWGGIGLAAALVLTLSAMTGNPREVHAVASRDEIGAPNRSRRTPHTEQDVRPTGAESRRAVSTSSPDPVSRAPVARDPAGGGATQEDAPRDKVAEGAGRSSAAGDSGSGGGVGHARNHAAAPEHSPNATNTVPLAAKPDRGGQASAGSGDASDQSPSTATAPATGGNVQTSSRYSPRTPPWRSASWPADVRAAREALEAGTVPDASRDLVREYFDRP